MQKMEFGQKKFREINLFDFTSFFGLDFFLIFWPTVMVVRYIYFYICPSTNNLLPFPFCPLKGIFWPLEAAHR